MSRTCTSNIWIVAWEVDSILIFCVWEHIWNEQLWWVAGLFFTKMFTPAK
jgi:hypothetical protein